MPRPKRCRRVGHLPSCTLFKPAGVPARNLQQVALSLDEYEALRLADYEGLYQQQAAERMGVSRQTFGRIIESARGKVAKALVEGLALRIEGGPIVMADMRVFECGDCGHVWQEPYGTGPPAACPACDSDNFYRTDQGGPGGGGGRGGRGGGPGAGRGAGGPGRCRARRGRRGAGPGGGRGRGSGP